MISIIFIMLAAISFAVVDVLSHHFPRSIFKKLKPQWWNPKKSWKNAYMNWDKGKRSKNISYMISDANNTFTYIGIIFFILAVVSPVSYISQSFTNRGLGRFILDVVILFFVYLIVYQIFYRIVFRKR